MEKPNRRFDDKLWPYRLFVQGAIVLGVLGFLVWLSNELEPIPPMPPAVIDYPAIRQMERDR